MHDVNATQSAAKILIVEDDRDLNSLLKFTIESSGDCSVTSAFESTGAMELVSSLAPDLVILDVMLPGGKSGLDLLRDIRGNEQLFHIPVILLTAKTQEIDRIDGFEAGADDYISKPFSPKELLLRVRALLRRTQTGASTQMLDPVSARTIEDEPRSTLKVGPVEIETDVFKVSVGGEPVALTSTEYQLLLYLAERAGRLQSRSSLLQKVWGYEGNVNTRTVDTHVKRLRQKLGHYGNMIETVHGFGYQMNEKPAEKARSISETSTRLELSE